jgi:transcriptional regulator with XRE-family HTH domain
MKDLKIDISKLKTQSQFARDNGMSRQRVNQLVKSKDLKTVEIAGAVLILID